ncbi:MAG TPA: phenylalanine--tRNA ligase subunit beta [Patescibacteria group bacterium]
MKVSLSWLKELVNYNWSPQELADRLSLKSIGVKEVNDNFIELDLTYNRGDLLSLRGVAREVAAISGTQIKFGNLPNPKQNLPEVSVKIENPKLAPVYCVAKIENLKVEKSSDSWIKKLADSGIRTVNNIADITNLIMLEYGQPMHAFDGKKVQNEEIIVRNAKKNETVQTLDGKNRILTTSDLLITDSQGILGLAGVMGAKNSEVSNSTNTILLEAAIFDPVTIRKTSMNHGLYSEAGKRFQHRLTKTNLLNAFAEVIRIYGDQGGKLTAISLVGDFIENPKTIILNYDRLNNLIGASIPKNEVESALNNLGFEVNSNDQGWEVRPPNWRLDIQIEEDLVEEVARIYGYEKIETKPLSLENAEPLDQSIPNLILSLKQKLKNIGLTEVETYSFYSSQVIENLNLNKKSLVKIANPITTETEYLRDFIWPNLIEVVDKNIKSDFSDIAIFEIGKVYSPKKEDLPIEEFRVSIALMNDTDNPITELEAIIDSLKITKPSGKLGDLALFHPTRRTKNSAEVHPRILNKFAITKRVAVFEINLEKSL